MNSVPCASRTGPAYEDRAVRLCLFAACAWGLLTLIAGLLLAALRHWPEAAAATAWMSYGRVASAHQIAALFGFGANAVFAGVLFSAQRLVGRALFCKWLGLIQGYGWQTVVATAVALRLAGLGYGASPLGMAWPVDLAIASLWALFVVNLIGTIARGSGGQLYISLWFYLAAALGVMALQVAGNLGLPTGPWESVPLVGGMRAALVAWWHDHNLGIYLVALPSMGLAYHLIPKRSGRPVYSYRLAVITFWGMVFFALLSGPAHRHLSPIPGWTSSVAMIGAIAWATSAWGGVVGGWRTLRGWGGRLRDEPALAFAVAGLLGLGAYALVAAVTAVKSVNVITRFTEISVGHAHGLLLAWGGLVAFGTFYWTVTHLSGRAVAYPALARWHLWLALGGITLQILPRWVTGPWEGLRWLSVAESGELTAPDFVQTTAISEIAQVAQAVGGILYGAGYLLMLVNLAATWRGRSQAPADAPALLEAGERGPAPAHEALERPAPSPTPLEASHAPVSPLAIKIERLLLGRYHARLAGRPMAFSLVVLLILGAGSLIALAPLLGAHLPTPRRVAEGPMRPYSPLELLGRRLYLREGCQSCHSQLIRPLHAETKRYGAYTRAAESAFDYPPPVGERRVGPDLGRIGGTKPHAWHVQHLIRPAAVVPGSKMPASPWLASGELALGRASGEIRRLAWMGVPYGYDELTRAPALARAQAQLIADEVATTGGPEGLEDREIVALIAYLQRLGTTPPAELRGR